MSKKNYLDYVPIRNSQFKWDKNKKDLIVVEVTHNGFFNKIAQIFFKVPKTSKIELDERGSFVWTCIDDKKDLWTIANEVKERFPEEETVFYERLLKFFEILKQNNFITFKN